MYFIFHEKLNNELVINIKNIIDEVGFVILKNDNTKINLDNLINYFGKSLNLSIFNIKNDNKKKNLILNLKPYISNKSKLNGFNFSNISPHTDTGFLNTPAEYIFIKMIKQDVINDEYGANGIVDVFKMVQKLNGSKLLKKLVKTKFPMISKEKNKIKFKPIIKLNKNNDLKLVRFHIDRILSAYKFLNTKPTNKESKLLNKFLKECYKNIQYFSLQEGEILIVDNHLMLHSRTSVNIEYQKDGNYNSRKVEVAFVRKNK